MACGGVISFSFVIFENIHLKKTALDPGRQSNQSGLQPDTSSIV